MRDASPTPTHLLPPAGGGGQAQADHASLQEKLRRGEIGGQALGLIQLVAAQRAGSESPGCEAGREAGHRRLAELN